MSIDKNPQNPFVQRFADDLKIHGMSERTIQSYCRALRKFIEFLRHAPDQATEDQLRKYLLFITEQLKWASRTRNVALQALKLYFRITYPRQLTFASDHLTTKDTKSTKKIRALLMPSFSLATLKFISSPIFISANFIYVNNWAS